MTKTVPKSIGRAAILLMLIVTATAHATDLKLLSVKKIWDAAGHNAFTDLTRFNDQWFCTFREAQGHVVGNGKIRVLVSPDGAAWKSAALLEEPGIDLRDPKLSIAPDNRLMLSIGGSIYKNKKLVERQPRVAFSTDGSTWTTPRRVLKPSDWLWRVTWHKGRAYGMVYGSTAKGPETERIVESTNGIDFKLLQKLDVTSRPNEATARFLTNDNCVVLVRREGDSKTTGDHNAWIGHSAPPYNKWTWKSAGMSVGGPNFLVLPNGKMIAAGRIQNTPGGPSKTFVGSMTETSITPEVILPSGGDCSYPGLVWYENVLWVSYYSSHEGKTSIYLAKIAVQ